ncbi:MAG: OmpW/AlkL family protein [Sphingomonadaceae bacterium]
MKPILLAMAGALAAMGFAGSAQAEGTAGKFQIKAMVTGVLPDGEIDEVKLSTIPLPANSQTEASDNVVPTLAAEYFFNDYISAETICCLTSHHVSGTDGLAGADIADHVMILPATLTIKAHADIGGIKPYVGAGPTMFFFIDEKPGDTMQVLGADRLKMKNSFGFALQAGVDIPMNEQIGLTFDAKKYFVSTTTHFYDTAGTEILSTKHDLDPWVIGGGVYYRF